METSGEPLLDGGHNKDQNMLGFILVPLFLETQVSVIMKHQTEMRWKKE